jgi:SWI/SNF-related matrix-associated actin-dependent regulator of chromatin subfamily A member 5
MVEKGETKLKRKDDMSTALKQKISMYSNPERQLKLPSQKRSGQLFTEEEDRFLVSFTSVFTYLYQVCATNKVGYGNWEELKREIKESDQFKFDWFFKSRTPPELSRRVDVLLRSVQKEIFGKTDEKVRIANIFISNMQEPKRERTSESTRTKKKPKLDDQIVIVI